MLGLTASSAKPFADTPLIKSPTSSSDWFQVTLVHHSGSWHFSSPLPVRSCVVSSTNIRRSRRHPASSLAPTSLRSKSPPSESIIGYRACLPGRHLQPPALPAACVTSRRRRTTYHDSPVVVDRPHVKGPSSRHQLASAVVSAAAVLIQSFPRSLNPLECFPRRPTRPP